MKNVDGYIIRYDLFIFGLGIRIHNGDVIMKIKEAVIFLYILIFLWLGLIALNTVAVEKLEDKMEQLEKKMEQWKF